MSPKSALPDFGLLLTDDRVARIDIDTPSIPTREGVRIGDSESKVLSVYRGKVRVEPNDETEGRYLVVHWPGKAKVGYVFETEGGVVKAIRAGRFPEITYYEGCE